MKANSSIKGIACILVFLLMVLSASFKLFHFGPSIHFYRYPLPDFLMYSVPYIELLGGILFLIGSKNIKFRNYGGIVLLPLLFGALCSHVFFGWFQFFNGVSEPLYLTIPSFSILLLVSWIVYGSFKESRISH